MDNLNNVLDLFPSREMKDQLNDIIRVINDISNKRPIVGFHHSFYVPGWIGIIQTTIVESKMNKFASSTFYRNMNYYEFGDWIINKSKELAELQNGTATDDKQAKLSQNEAIIRIFEVLTALWVNYLPEISTYHNIKYTENTLISPAGMVYKGLEENLNIIGYTRNSDSSHASKSSFKEETKSFLYGIVGYIINIILLACIFGILGTIFG